MAVTIPCTRVSLIVVNGPTPMAAMGQGRIALGRPNGVTTVMRTAGPNAGDPTYLMRIVLNFFWGWKEAGCQCHSSCPPVYPRSVTVGRILPTVRQMKLTMVPLLARARVSTTVAADTPQVVGQPAELPGRVAQLGRPAGASRAQCDPPSRVGDQFRQSVGHHHRIPGRAQHPARLVDQFRRPPGGRGHHRQPGEEGLDQGDAERFGAGVRLAVDVGGRQQGGHVRPRRRTEIDSTR